MPNVNAIFQKYVALSQSSIYTIDEVMFIMTFGERIKKIRNEKAITLEELAKRIKVSNGTISRWETGEIKNIRSDKIGPLADALGTSSDYILGLTKSQIRVSEWPSAVPKDAVQSVEIIKKSVDSMLSSITHSNYGLKLFNSYAEVISLLTGIDSFAQSKRHELRLDYPGFEFGSEMDMVFDGVNILMALAIGDEDAKDFAKKLTLIHNEIDNEIIKVNNKISDILLKNVADAIKAKKAKPDTSAKGFPFEDD